MAVCATPDIKTNLSRCGRKALVKGLYKSIFVGSLSQHKPALTYSETNKLLLTAITLPVGGPKLLKYEGVGFGNQETNEMQVSEYSKDFLQRMRNVIFSRDENDELELMNLKEKEDLFFIYQLRNGIFKCMGIEAGLEVKTMTNDSNDDNLKGAWIVTSEGLEANVPLTIRHSVGGIDDTAAYLLALVKADV